MDDLINKIYCLEYIIPLEIIVETLGLLISESGYGTRIIQNKNKF